MLALAAVDVDGDAPERALGQAALEAGPRVAAVGRLEDAAAGAAAVHAARRSPALIHRRVEDLAVRPDPSRGRSRRCRRRPSAPASRSCRRRSSCRRRARRRAPRGCRWPPRTRCCCRAGRWRCGGCGGRCEGPCWRRSCRRRSTCRRRRPTTCSGGCSTRPCRPRPGPGCSARWSTSPIDIRPWSWNWASNVVPLFLVFQTPPCAVPT